ncbi:prolipoprotein diacylglyceryl transferase [Wolbachia endosymbiont of Pentidionis agamae]|uniref:prolipoprotein diacylglyceryl transferase n=1 Tax=Wolbachia endosymbiont of Pentidionis agamae TaxID=3110435 RepID=UPI002FD5870F
MVIDPVIFSIGPISVYWYSLAYVLGILYTYWFLHKADYYEIFTKEFLDTLLTNGILGVVLGARLGDVLIYDFKFYLSNPIQILKTWEGGMSFHGGAIGVSLATLIACRKHNVPIFYTSDLIFCGAPVGLFLGRIGNFINGELFGRVTTMPWGMVFSESGDNFTRHPSQLYEAFFEGFLLFVLLNSCFFFTKISLHRGALTGIAILWYGLVRFLVEFFREPDYHIGYPFMNLTIGQILSIPMVCLGLFICIKAIKFKPIQKD